MAYPKHTWEDDEVITKDKLNSIEEGIYSMSINKIDKPIEGGESGQVLITNGDDTNSWVTIKTHKGSVVSYGNCTSAADTVKKTCNVNEFDELKEGAVVQVKFKNINTAENPTLNVNSTGAKPIVSYDNIPVGNTKETSWLPNSTVTLIYDGNNWVIDNGGLKAISDAMDESWDTIDCGTWG